MFYYYIYIHIYHYRELWLTTTQQAWYVGEKSRGMMMSRNNLHKNGNNIAWKNSVSKVAWSEGGIERTAENNPTRKT